MLQKMKNPTILNIFTNLILQFITILSGFIIPKLILENFGSDVNGLISSITQFLSYISLLEGGVTGVIMTSLYKPLVNKDYKQISSVLHTSNSFFKKISIIFLCYSFIISIVYPLAFDIEFSYLYVMSLTWILSIGLFIQYMFSLSLKTLLNADKKIYIVSLVQILIVSLNILVTFVIIKCFPNVHFLKFFNGILYLFQPIIFTYYAKKYYKIDKNAIVDNTLLKNRWNGFAVNFANFIHYSTDITILTIFTNLETVSIYSVYTLVTNGLKQLVQSFTNSFNPIIGQAYAKGDEEVLNRKIDLYEFLILYIVGILFTISILLITPFVMIYTSGVSNSNYYQPLFGILILVSEALYLVKFPHLHLAYAANKYKEVTPAAFIEAFLNIILSIPLVILMGLPGVAIGTLIAMIYRLFYHIFYTSKLIPSRRSLNSIKKLLFIVFISTISIWVCSFFGKIEFAVINWILYAIIYSFVIVLMYLIFGILFFNKEFKLMIKYFRK